MEEEKSLPLYRRIHEDLRTRILSGDLPVGSRIPTERELMSAYATSRITAARAVNELENLGYIVRAKAKGSFVNPRTLWKNGPTLHAGGKTRATISFILPAPAGKISLEMEVLHGAELECHERGYALAVRSVETETGDEADRRRKEKDIVAEALQDGSVGIIIYPCSTMDSPEVYNRMACRDFPFVLLDRKVFGLEAPLVSSDNRGGFRSLIEHLVSYGHSRIAFVSGNTFESSSRGERFSGYVQGLNDAKLKVFDEYIEHNLFPVEYRNAYYSELEKRNQVLREAIKEMLGRFLSLKNPPTAITTSNDYIALNILNVAASMGIDIPGTVSLAGFDGLSIGSYFTPKLTTVAQNFERIGRETITLLDRRISDPLFRFGEIRIPTTLQPGESVGRLPKASNQSDAVILAQP